jgi:hypothetical protein
MVSRQSKTLTIQARAVQPASPSRRAPCSDRGRQHHLEATPPLRVPLGVTLNGTPRLAGIGRPDGESYCGLFDCITSCAASTRPKAGRISSISAATNRPIPPLCLEG